MLVGITRIVVAIFHIIGHCFAALITQDKGHLYHATKGACEGLRSLVEMIPIVGNLFSLFYSNPCCAPDQARSWWMIKIYNPQHPDIVDRVAELDFDDYEKLGSYWCKAKQAARDTGRDYYICADTAVIR